jgi:hypothetical protein
MPPSRPSRASLLSDDLLQHLIAVGQVDVLVGLPTLDNASTVGPVVLAIHEAIARGFGRARLALINSDGGSQDGTQEAVRQASGGSADLLLASHTLRTMHRVVAPFHGLPGRRSALHTIFAAADLLQARAVVIVDPSVVEPSADLIAALLKQVLEAGFDFVAQAPRRHPREGPLLTQVLRPLMGSLLGACFDDPLGQQYSLSGALVGHALAQPLWDDEPLRPGIDLALHTEAVAGGFRGAQLGTLPRNRVLHPGRPGVRETVQQVMKAAWTLLALHEPRWIGGDARVEPPVRLALEDGHCQPPAWDADAFERTFREDVQQLQGIWRDVLSPSSRRALESAAAGGQGLAEREWAGIVGDFCLAWRAGRFSPDHLAGAFFPVYLGRLATFLHDTETVDPDGAAQYLARINQAFAAAKPSLLKRWLAVTASGGER